MQDVLLLECCGFFFFSFQVPYVVAESQTSQLNKIDERNFFINNQLSVMFP